MSDLYDNKDIDSTTMTFNSDYKFKATSPARQQCQSQRQLKRPFL